MSKTTRCLSVFFLLFAVVRAADVGERLFYCLPKNVDQAAFIQDLQHHWQASKLVVLARVEWTKKRETLILVCVLRSRGRTPEVGGRVVTWDRSDNPLFSHVVAPKYALVFFADYEKNPRSGEAVYLREEVDEDHEQAISYADLISLMRQKEPNQ